MEAPPAPEITVIKSTPSYESEPLLYGIEGAAKRLSLGRSTIYKLMDDGTLESVKIGNRRLISTASIHALADTTSGQAV